MLVLYPQTSIISIIRN